MGHSILIVHADREVRAGARRVLEQAGHDVRESGDLDLDDHDGADLILIAWTALSPAADALRPLGKSSGHALRIVVLAPRRDLRTAIGTLDLGADDCVPVPFDPEELLGRVNACLRRPPATTLAERLTAGPLVLDRGVHRMLVNEHIVELAPAEFRLMAFFLENQGRVFSRNELLARAWARNVKAGNRTVDVHVRRLRKHLEQFGCAEMIQTVRGFGYRFTAHN